MSHRSYRSHYYRVRHLDARPIWEHHSTLPEHVLVLPGNRLIVAETHGANESSVRFSLYSFWKCGTHWKLRILGQVASVLATDAPTAGVVSEIQLFRVDDKRSIAFFKQSTDSTYDGYGVRFYARLLEASSNGALTVGDLVLVHNGDLSGSSASLDYASTVEAMRAHDQDAGTSYALVYCTANTFGVSAGRVRHIGVTGSGVGAADLAISNPATWSESGLYDDYYVRGGVGSFDESNLLVAWGEYVFDGDTVDQGRNLMRLATWTGAQWEFGPVSELDTGYSMRNQYEPKPTIEGNRIAFVYTWYEGTVFRDESSRRSTRASTATYVVPVSLVGGSLLAEPRTLLFANDGDNETYHFEDWGETILMGFTRYQPSDGTLRTTLTELWVDPQDATGARRVTTVADPDTLSPIMDGGSLGLDVINAKMALVRYISTDYADDEFTHFAVVERPFVQEATVVEDLFIDTEFDRRYSYQPEWLAG